MRYYEDALHDCSPCHNWMAIMAIEKIVGFLKLLDVHSIFVSHVDFYFHNIDWGQFCTEMESYEMDVIFEEE